MDTENIHSQQTEGSNVESNNEEMNENPSWMVRKCLVVDTHFALTMPVSTTYLSPGMVTEDSAMLVESTTLRQPWGGGGVGGTLDIRLFTDYTLNSLSAVQYTTVQYTTVHYSTVHYSTLQYSTLQYSTLQYTTVQYTTVQYSTVQYSTVHYSTVQYSTVQYSTLQYSTVQYSTVQYTTVQYSTVQYSTVHYSTVQYSTLQYSTVQYSTVQYSTLQWDVGVYTQNQVCICATVLLE